MKIRRSGFSLLEVMISMFLLTILGLFVFNLFPVIRRGMQFTENQIYAAYLGKSLLEQARASGFDALAPSSGSQTLSGTDNGVLFTQTINYTVSINSVTTGEKRIFATMTWHEATGNRRMVIETLLAKYQ
jgi:prepilin-type N-terminal cleavage/methylation domain-containing protein